MNQMMDLQMRCTAAVGYALFDMDGTLFDGDLGETAFLLSLLGEYYLTDAWNLTASMLRSLDVTRFAAQEGRFRQYCTYLKEGNYVDAYQLTANYMASHSPQTVKRICAYAFEAFADPTLRLSYNEVTLALFVRLDPVMLSLIKACSQAVVVSASPRSVVEAFVELNDIRAVSIIAAEGRVEDLPYAEAKVRLAQRAGIRTPFIAFGNSEGDIAMLNWAEHAVLRANDASPSLVQKADQMQWTVITT